jgi:copper chaperone CopZ
VLVNLVNAKKGAAASVTNCLKEVDADVNKVSAKVDAAASPTNFRDDVNVDGSVTQTDVNITQGQVGTSIP